MNISLRNLPAFLVASGLGLALAANLSAQSTAFTYQGRLNDGATPATGLYDLRFILHGDAVLPGFEVGLPQTNNAVTVTNGLFTSVVDFGGAWDNQPRWIEVAVKATGSTNAFTPLAPRQLVTVSPKADYANRAATLSSALTEGLLPASTLRRYVNETVTGFYTFNPLPGNPPFAVSSSVLVPNLNADLLDGLDSSAFWKLGGNAGTTPGTHFLGTTDNQALEFKVNGQRALRIEYAANYFGISPNLVGGSPGNVVSNGCVGAVICGGGTAAYPNRVGGDHATVVGGVGNLASGPNSIAMGTLTRASDLNSTAMGAYSTASGTTSTALGWGTTASGPNSIAMGSSTTASGDYSTAMGSGTTASGDYSTAVGASSTASGYSSTAMGTRAKANHTGTFVWSDSTQADFGSSASNQFLVRASGGVGINTTNPGNFALAVNGTVNASKLEINAGSAASPAYAFLGDFSTGLFRPAAGAVSLATSGTERMRINAAGVGIGTTLPGAMLQVGDVNTSGSQGMMRFASRSGSGPANRYWDIGVPQGGENLSGKFYSFVIDDPQLGADPEVVVRYDTGNVGIGLTNPASRLHVNGTVTATAFNPPSDRNLKENFRAVDPQQVLAKVAALPISEWNFIGDAATPHVGPMAQDFHAAFGLGTDERHIATVDADGVALAAIQGLNQKLEEKEARIKELEQRLSAIEAQLLK